jgi:hypothetical protein
MSVANELNGKQSSTRKGRSIRTYSGIAFWPLDPKESEIEIEDIAHSLSMLCRFNGHLKSFYSVAQHSVLVSGLCSKETQLWGLMHDAAEAYISDMPAPIKLEMPNFIDAEHVIQRVICNKFGLDIEEPDDVRKADLILRVTEMRDLRKSGMITSYYEYTPLKEKIKPWTQQFAKEAFLSAYESLTIKSL